MDVRELPSHTLKAGCWSLPLGLVMRLEPSLEPWKEGYSSKSTRFPVPPMFLVPSCQLLAIGRSQSKP